jgi:DNA repair protein RadC
MDGHRQRLYERFEEVGLKGFSEHEKLEILLTLVIARRDCKSIAKNLLKHFGSLSAMFHANAQEWVKVNGIGPKSALFLSVIKAVVAESFKQDLQKKQIFNQAHEVVSYLFLARETQRREVLKVLYLDAKNALIADEIMGEGTIDEVPVYIRSLVEEALKHNAKGVILVHNHPSGNPRPSQADKDITKKIQEALKLIQVDVLDHIILGDQRYVSFVKEGFLRSS